MLNSRWFIDGAYLKVADAKACRLDPFRLALLNRGQHRKSFASPPQIERIRTGVLFPDRIDPRR